MRFFSLLLFLTPAAFGAPAQLLWPVDCVPGADCRQPGYADPGNTGKTHDCSPPGYVGHQGTDIPLDPPGRYLLGVDVFAAADGKVLWVFDGKFDGCGLPGNEKEPDCAEPAETLKPGESRGTQVCTPLGPYCRDGAGECYWCFAGGNVIVIRHEGLDGVFATRYDHLKKGSIRVKPGDHVKAGQKIALAGSAGHSTSPHLHFEVWGKTFYDPVDPWPGACNSRVKESLWKFPSKPWASLGRP